MNNNPTISKINEFLKNNNYQFREIEKNLVSEKLAPLYEKYYIIQKNLLISENKKNKQQKSK